MRYCTNEFIWILVFWNHCIYFIYEFLGDDVMNKNHKNNSIIPIEFILSLLTTAVQMCTVMIVGIVSVYCGIRIYFLLYKLMTGISSSMDLTILIQLICIWVSLLIVFIGIILVIKLIAGIKNIAKNIYDFFTSDENYDD